MPLRIATACSANMNCRLKKRSSLTINVQNFYFYIKIKVKTKKKRPSLSIDLILNFYDCRDKFNPMLRYLPSFTLPFSKALVAIKKGKLHRASGAPAYSSHAFGSQNPHKNSASVLLRHRVGSIAERVTYFLSYLREKSFGETNRIQYRK